MAPKGLVWVGALGQGEYSRFNVINQSKTARTGTQTARTESSFVSMKANRRENSINRTSRGVVDWEGGAVSMVRVKV